MSFIKKACKIGANILFWITIAAFVLVTVAMLYARIGGNGRMTVGGIGFGRVVTGSMDLKVQANPENPLPSIPVGSFIVTKQTEASTLKVGDVITFYSDDPTVPQGIPVSHMILRIETNESGSVQFITKGTANPSEDEYPVFEEDIIGKVVFTSSFIGSLIGISQSPYIYPVLILLLFVSMIQSILDVIKQYVVYTNDKSTNSN